MDEPTASVVRAARQAFIKYGPDRTTMSDVARSAGVVRQTLYYTVSSRDQLVELAMVQCCEELQEQIDSWNLGEAEDLDEALVEFLARAVEVTHGDAELAALAAALPPDRAKAVFGESHPIEALIHSSLRPLLARAESDGRLRPGVTPEEASRWLQGVLTFALLRDDPRPEALREELRKFAVPSVLSADGKPSRRKRQKS
ncbi:AcrR family transcriptional regulator [Mycolicibacterium sp. BK634]|uniref:TetR/AcrR family transcriptional regulator n=1 Tax=Mycobacteriaceae TaxID=1762 RepID=UPI00105E8ECA|nr:MULTISPECIES: TetR/AcrR family transcriptional regulator [Mycobacteriaceae]MBB3748376.1 AcrR family transcriptional regulator [Mycolicibacterium sp. BK634]TDO10165.1 TetR family transcriptional regulator [Mycobacterium sp. BK086]